MSNHRLRLGIDLGGTKIEIVALDVALDGRRRELLRRRVATPAGDYLGTVAAVADLVAAAERSQLLIESGNQAYTTGNFGLAARRYAAAAVIREDDPAAYYGLGMALSKLGRDEDARAAYARARELSRR